MPHRAAATRLALIAYHLDHGEYPPTLKQLVPKYTAALEVDPFSGEPFEYAPNGFPIVMKAGDVPMRPYTVPLRGDLTPGTPAIWTVGTGDAKPVPKLQRRAPESEDDQSVEMEEVMAWEATTGLANSGMLLPLPTSDAYPNGSTTE